MPLLNTIRSDDAQIEPVATDAEASTQLNSTATVPARKPQRLDVDQVLARSLPSPGAYAIKEIKINVSR
jgi:hypothetical protein